MLQQNISQSPLEPLSLSEILEVLSLEYEEDLNGLIHSPHQWLIIKDENTGIMGGMCLTPRSSLPTHPMLADFCKNLKSDQAWVGSHLFCWVPEDIEAGSKEEDEAISAFYGQLYCKLLESFVSTGSASLWMIVTALQYTSAAEMGLLPFDKQMPFTHQGTDFVAALLPLNPEMLKILRQSQAVYSQTSQYKVN